MIILGIDPGLARVGWGVIKEEKGKQEALDFGLFETAATLSLDERLLKIHQFLTDLIKKYKPDVLAVELLYFGANAKTALVVGHSRGVIILTAAQKEIPTVSYTPLQIKMSLTGYGRAEKKQIQTMVKASLKLPKPLTQDDTADALAVALTHAFSYKLNGIIQNK